jgi:hypothetical protein
MQKSGKYDMAMLHLHKDSAIEARVARRLAEQAVALILKPDDPRSAARQYKPRKKR